MMLSYEKLKQMDLRFVESGEQCEPEELSIALCTRYPFLAPRNRFTGEVIAFSNEHFYERRFTTREDDFLPEDLIPKKGWSELSDLDRGWRKAFGVEICEDIRTVLLAAGGEHALESYRIVEIKEKFGSMRWYSTFDADDLPTSGPRLEAIGANGFRTGSGIDSDPWKWLSFVEEFYCALAGFICIFCGGVENVRRTRPWVLPVCPCSERWGEEGARELPRPKRDEPFAVWARHRGGEVEKVSYKDMIVGRDAPVVSALHLDRPLRATEVWETAAV